MKIDIKRKFSFTIDWFVLFLIIMFLIRLYLAKAVPVFVVANAGHDDEWCFERAVFLVKGQWLGTYNELTLTKGITFPVFLLLTYVSEVPCSIMLILTQAVSAGIFFRAVKPLIPNRYVRGLMFLIMIYAPVTMDYSSALRIYRNVLTWPCALAVISGFIAIYLRIREKPSVGWYIYAGFSLFAFANLREDVLWLYPFIGCAVVLTAVSWLIGKKQGKGSIRNLAFLMIPFCLAVFGNLGICVLNDHYYGVFTRNDRSGTAFKTVCEAFLNTDCGENDDPVHVWVTRDQYEKVVDASPTLTEIKDELLKGYDMYAANWLDDGQCDGDFYVWALRSGASMAGYYTDAATTKELWEKAAEELDQAFEDGILEKSEGQLLSFSCRKLRTEDIGQLLKDAAADFYMNASAEGTEMLVFAVDTSVNITDIRKYEAFFHDFMIYDSVYMDDAADPVARPTKYIVPIDNAIISVYKAAALPMLLMIPVSVIVSVILLIRTDDRENRRRLLQTVILSVGLLLSAFLMQAMVTWFVSFMDSAGRSSMMTFYASPVHPMVMLAALLPAVTCGQVLMKEWKKKRSRA